MKTKQTQSQRPAAKPGTQTPATPTQTPAEILAALAQALQDISRLAEQLRAGPARDLWGNLKPAPNVFVPPAPRPRDPNRPFDDLADVAEHLGIEMEMLEEAVFNAFVDMVNEDKTVKFPLMLHQMEG